ncbi:hypothetical protein ACFL5Z_08335 [Planctomycetota bacterium]
MRKILIGFASLGVVLSVYLLYARISDTPEIDTDRAAEVIKSTADGNAVDFDSEMGKISGVGVGPVRKARYITLNEKTKEVEREFGFEKLLHEVRDVWEIEKPYMNVYRRNFKCFVTADKGQVQVETAVGRTTPKDATFSSNVVIHIVPIGTGGIKESFVYLDDIIFLSEKSLLSTAGPVRFESEDARMRGKGLELIYNEQAERLEYFKIADLESMSYRITDSQAAVFSSTQTPTESGTQTETQEPNDTMIANVSDEEETPPTKAEPELPVEQQKGEYYKCVLNDNVLIDTPEQLIFADKKLLIHDIFWDKAFLGQADEVDEDRTDTTEPTRPAVVQDPQSKSPTLQSSGDKAQSIAEPNVPITEPTEPNEAPDEKPSFIVITCDGGLIIVPKDSTRIPAEPAEAGVEATPSDTERHEQLDDGTKRTWFFARTIDYNTVTGDMTGGGLSKLTYYRTDANTTEANEPSSPVKITAREGAKYSKVSNQVVFSNCLCTMPQAGLTEQRDVTFTAPEITVDLPEEKSKQPDILAAGPVELAFYMEPAAPDANPDITGEDANLPMVEGQSFDESNISALVPVTVNARTRARYSAALNQMAFEGDCQCTMLREDPNVIEEYVLLSERMTVDLAEDVNDRTSGPATGVEHLTATGEIVRLATTRTAKADGAFADVLEDPNGTRLLGGVELKCRQFDYDAVQQLYWATGPGIIKLNNTLPADPNEQSRPFSLRDPCWAIVSGFDTLRYSLLDNRIFADAPLEEKLGIVYFPTTTGEDSGDVSAEASHVEAFLRETAEGQTELATLNATGGVLYEDDRGHQFIGSELFYDHTLSIVKVKGDEVQPCYYNGILVDKIKYDVNADKVEFNVVGPGAIQLGK